MPVKLVDFNIDRTREATLRMFDRSEYPDAVFVANDHMAFAVMDSFASHAWHQHTQRCFGSWLR